MELPLGTSFDASQEGSYPQLVPALCDGAVLRAGSLAFDPNVISSTGDTPAGTANEAAIRWDQVDKRAFPVHPGSYTVQWPDANDPGTNYLIEFVTGYPGDQVSLSSEREVMIDGSNGDSSRQTSTTVTSMPVLNSAGQAVLFPPTPPNPNLTGANPLEAVPLYFVTSTTMSRVNEDPYFAGADFPGSTQSPFPDAHYRHRLPARES